MLWQDLDVYGLILQANMAKNSEEKISNYNTEINWMKQDIETCILSLFYNLTIYKVEETNRIQQQK